MAHDISVLNGQPTIAYFGETPWHKLGTSLDIAIAKDLKATLIAAGLADWQVHSQPHFLADGRLNPHSKAVVRGIDNSILGSVGPNTELVQNEEAFAPIQPLLEEFGAHIEVAGALGNGSRVWALVKLPKAIEPVPGDVHDGYLFVRHAHDNSLVTEAIPTLVRVVCANTSAAAVEAAGGDNTNKGRIFRLKKTQGIHAGLKDAEVLLRRVAQAFESTGDTFASLAARKVTPLKVAEYIEDLFPLPFRGGKEVDSKTVTERRKTIARLVFEQPGAELAGVDPRTGEATPYALYNAITRYFDHVRPDEAQKPSAKRAAAESAIFGANAALKVLALAKARDLAYATV